MRFPPILGFTDPGVRQIGRLMIPGLFGMGVTQIMILVDSFVASMLREGSVSALYYSGRINELALGSFAISISTVILPALSLHAAAGRTDELRATLLYGFRIVAFITVPSAVGLFLLREPIIATLFERGRFTAADTLFAAEALRFYALGLLPFGAVKILAPAFYSQKDTRTPAILAAWTLGGHIVLCPVLATFMGIKGIALASSVSATVNMSLLMAALSRRHGLLWGRNILPYLLKVGGAAAVMGAVAVPMLGWLKAGTAAWPIGGFIALLGTLGLSACAYFMVCHLAGIRELHDVIAALGRRSRRDGLPR
jgi:putative peptidoglycan lipid II flippase